MPDPLTPEQIADTKDAWDGVGCEVISAAVIQDLIATIEQAWAERDGLQVQLDAAYSVIRMREVGRCCPDLDAMVWRLIGPDFTEWQAVGPITPQQAVAITRARDTTRPDTTP